MAKKKVKKLSRKRVDNFDYQTAEKKLKKFGFKVTSRGKKGKTALRSLWRTKSAYIKFISEPRKVTPIVGIKKVSEARKKKGGKIKIGKTSKLSYQFKFQKLSPKQRVAALKSKLFSKAQYTPTGIFIERPEGIPAKDYRVRFKKGAVEINSDCRNDEILLLDAGELAANPDATIRRAIDNRTCLDSRGNQKTVKSYSLMVNGFRAQTSSSLSEKTFIWYLTNKLLPEWLEKNEDENTEGFTDTFHVRLIY